jgi:hypothetical protein
MVGVGIGHDETGASTFFDFPAEPGMRHIMVTVDATGAVTGYVDGQVALEGTVPANAPMAWQELPFVAINASDSGHPWAGDLALLAVYDRALSAEEVQHNFDIGY